MKTLQTVIFIPEKGRFASAFLQGWESVMPRQESLYVYDAALEKLLKATFDSSIELYKDGQINPIRLQHCLKEAHIEEVAHLDGDLDTFKIAIKFDCCASIKWVKDTKHLPSNVKSLAYNTTSEV